MSLLDRHDVSVCLLLQSLDVCMLGPWEPPYMHPAPSRRRGNDRESTIAMRKRRKRIRKRRRKGIRKRRRKRIRKRRRKRIRKRRRKRSSPRLEGSLQSRTKDRLESVHKQNQQHQKRQQGVLHNDEASVRAAGSNVGSTSPHSFLHVALQEHEGEHAGGARATGCSPLPSPAETSSGQGGEAAGSRATLHDGGAAHTLAHNRHDESSRPRRHLRRASHRAHLLPECVGVEAVAEMPAHRPHAEALAPGHPDTQLEPGKRADWAKWYRPITLLRTVGKLYEKLVHDRLVDVLDIKQVLSDAQGGIRRDR